MWGRLHPAEEAEHPLEPAPDSRGSPAPLAAGFQGPRHAITYIPGDGKGRDKLAPAGHQSANCPSLALPLPGGQAGPLASVPKSWKNPGQPEGISKGGLCLAWGSCPKLEGSNEKARQEPARLPTVEKLGEKLRRSETAMGPCCQVSGQEAQRPSQGQLHGWKKTDPYSSHVQGIKSGTGMQQQQASALGCQ